MSYMTAANTAPGIQEKWNLRNKGVVPGLYVLSLVLYASTQLISMTQFFNADAAVRKYLTAINICAIVFCVFNVLRNNRITYTYIVYSLIFLLLSICVSFSTGVTWFLYPIIIIICSLGIDYRLILKTLMWINLIGVLLVASLASLGVIPNEPIYRVLKAGGQKARYTLGFMSPNNIGVLLLSCTVCFFSLYGLKKIYEYIALLFMVGVLLYFLDSRASALALLCMILVGAVNVCMPKIYNAIIKPVSILLLCVAPLASILLSVLYQNGRLDGLNRLSSDRIAFGHYFLSEYGVTPFGQPLRLVSTNEAAFNNTDAYVLDNSYLYILVQFGIIFFAFILISYFMFIKHSLSSKLLGGLCVLLIYCIFENALLRININPMLLMIFAANQTERKSFPGDAFSN